MRRWMGKETGQGSNKFRDKRGTDGENGQSKVTHERRAAKEEARWWKQKREQTEAPHRTTLHLSNVLTNHICVFLSSSKSAFERKSGGGSYTRDGPRRRRAAGAEPRERSVSPSALDGSAETQREPRLHAALQKQRF